MCKSCQASFVQYGNIKTVVHESGCPDSWMGKKYMCKWCGNDFVLESKDDNHEVCSHSCMVAYNGFDCDCEECRGDSELGNSEKYYDTHCQNCEELFDDCTCTEEDFE